MGQKIDVLNRDAFIVKLMTLVETLSLKKQGCCFGVNGAWGSGKSFVLERFEEKMREQISEKTMDNKYYVFHYNCWKYDYYEEPAVAIIASMLDEVTKELEFLPSDARDALRLSWKTAKNTMTEIAREICKNKVGIDLVAIAEKTLQEHDESKNSSFDILCGFNRALGEARKKIQEIAENKTMVIVVDELDRCLPEYAIKVLERLHHLFVDLDNVIVIVSMDKKQLEHSIKGIYGDIEVDDYLRKFISFKIDLEIGAASNFFEKYKEYTSMFECSKQEAEAIERFFSDITEGLGMRTQEHIFHKAEIIHKMVTDGKIKDCSIMSFEILLLVAIHITKDFNVEWIVKSRNAPISKSALGEQEAKIRRSFKGKMYMYEKVIGDNGIRYNGMPKIQENWLEKTFFWIAAMYNEYNNGECGGYYYDKGAKGRVALINDFAKFVTIIDND